MAVSADAQGAVDPEEPCDPRPLLLFFTSTTSGPSRRMRSLVAWVEVTRKSWLRVVVVDIGLYPEVAARLGVDDVPTVVLVTKGSEIGRIEGRTTAETIGRLVDRLAPGRSAVDAVR